MRMRKKKWVDPYLASPHRQLLQTPADFNELNLNPATTYLEIGCGLGDFVIATAQANPDKTYIALEKDVNCVAKCLRKVETMELPNIYFIRTDAKELELWFANFQFAGMYLLFSDPWPKKPYAKRRLTHRSFLQKYRRILQDGAFLYFKTDNRNLFEFTLVELELSPFKLELITDDYYSLYEEGAMTMYERKFKNLGMPIHHILAKKETHENN